jgi:predicted ester cyclase
MNHHDVAGLVMLYAPDAVLESPMFDTVRGRDAIGASYARLFAILPDYASRISDMLVLSEGDRAAVFSTVTGTHQADFLGLRPTGQPLEYHVARLLTFRDGFIVFERRIYDYRGVLERLEKTRLDQEMALASAVQHALCQTRHAGPHFEVVGASVPCRAIGGDFLEYVDLSEGVVAVALGDVAGKGPASALIASMLQGMLATLGPEDRRPSVALSRLNLALCRRGIQPRFATLTYGTLAPSGQFTYSNAGHTPPLALSARGGELLTEGGPILGVFPDATFPEDVVDLVPGDSIVIVSDGVTEAENVAGEDFGLGRLKAVAEGHRHESPGRLLERLWDAVRGFTGGITSADDATIAVLRRR